MPYTIKYGAFSHFIFVPTVKVAPKGAKSAKLSSFETKDEIKEIKFVCNVHQCDWTIVNSA